MSPELEKSLAWAKHWMETATDAEKAMWDAQRESWCRGPHGPTDGMGTVYFAVDESPDPEFMAALERGDHLTDDFLRHACTPDDALQAALTLIAAKDAQIDAADKEIANLKDSIAILNKQSSDLAAHARRYATR